MITENKKIANAFYAFHDGEIVFEREVNSVLIWKIECEYLAEIFNPEFQWFWIKIYGCNFIQFNPWMNPAELPIEIWTSFNDIFKVKLEILSAKAKGNRVEITCNQSNSNHNFSGGELLMNCEGVEIFDEKWNEIESDKLTEISKKYWNNLK